MLLYYCYQFIASVHPASLSHSVFVPPPSPLSYFLVDIRPDISGVARPLPAQGDKALIIKRE